MHGLGCLALVRMQRLTHLFGFRLTIEFGNDEGRGLLDMLQRFDEDLLAAGVKLDVVALGEERDILLFHKAECPPFGARSSNRPSVSAAGLQAAARAR